jgi:folate-binding protein YgfZ
MTAQVEQYPYEDRGRLALRGEDRVRFLHGMVTADVEKLGAGGGTRAAMLSVKGRLLAELTIYARPDELLLSMDLSLRDKVQALLDKHIVMDDVEVIDRGAELGELGLYDRGAGDGAAEALGRALALDAGALRALRPHGHLEAGGAHPVMIARDPSLGGDGFRLFGTRERLAGLAAGAPLMSAEAREVRRIEAGTARYGLDLDEERLVVEANLEDAISFDKGCYLGQEVVVRATSRGRVNRRLSGLVLDRPAPRGAHLRTPDQPEAGVLTSTAASPRFGAIALGYVHRTAIDADALLDVEGGGRAGRVDLPFERGAVEAARKRLGGS